MPVFTYFLRVQNKKGAAGVNLLTRPGLVAIMCEVVVTATHYGGLERASMEIVQKSPGDLIPYENNTKQHPPEQVDMIAESIRRFGFWQPIVVDRDNVVVIGHGRLMAAKKLMLDTVPVTYADTLTDEQIQALRLADNKTNESPWDFGKLEEELSALSIAGVDMTAFGFDDLEAQIDSDQVQEVETPEVPEEPKSKRGEIYRLGVHRLMCGDSTSREDIAALMGGQCADMVFTDPPYGYKYESNYQDKFKMLENDDKILDYVNPSYGIIQENCPVYSFCGWQTIKKWLEYFENTQLSIKNVIVWKKNNWSMGDLTGAYAGQYEFIIYLNKGRVELKGSRDTDIWEFNREPPKEHPTTKPIDLIVYAIGKSSEQGDIVLDLFGGSGSTLLACEQTGRKCFMMELDPHYIDVIIKRWENFTGQKAELIKGAE